MAAAWRVLASCGMSVFHTELTFLRVGSQERVSREADHETTEDCADEDGEEWEA